MRKEHSVIAAHVQKLAPSGIRAFFDLVLQMKDVISLGVGEPDFVTPWNIRETGIFSLEKGFTSYTSNKGLYKLRTYVHRFIKNRYGLDYSPDEDILITVGVSEALDLAVRALCDPGDEFIVPQPCYVAYGAVIELAGGKPVYISTTPESGFKLTPAQLERACTRRTKGMVINYPSNPTGSSYTKPELLALNRVCHKHGIIVISDEVYDALQYEGQHVAFASLPGARPRTIYLNGFSKAFAMTGWRIAYACGPREIISAMTKIHQYTMLCAPIMGQMAACEALQGGTKSVEQMRREYLRRRDFMVGALNDIGLLCHEPQGAFYVFPSVAASGLSAMDFAGRLLKEEKVAVVPGTAFGSAYASFVRMSYATSYEQLKEAVARMRRFLGRIRAGS